MGGIHTFRFLWNGRDHKPPTVGSFILQQNGSYVARTEFEYEKNGVWGNWSTQTGNQLVGQTHHVVPATLGVPNLATVRFHLWVMAGYDTESKQSFIYDEISENIATFTSSGITVGANLTFNGIQTIPIANTVTEAQLKLANEVGDKVCAEIHAQRSRGAENAILSALAKDPMQVMIDNGLPEDFFSSSPLNIKSELISYLKNEAESEMDVLKKRQQPRGFFKCWACRIGFGIVFGLIGLAISAATVGDGGAIFIGGINFMVSFGLLIGTAEGIMIAATTTGGISLAGGLTALIAFICEKIPDTCS